MLKERIQEIFEFTKSESPYRKANKGWINQDIFLDLSPSSDTFKQNNEAAKITVFWTPVNTFLSNIFIILIISSILVFTSLSFAKGRFNFNYFNTSSINDIRKVEDSNVVKTNQLKDIDYMKSEEEKSLAINEIDNTNKINSLDDNQINSDQETITNEIDKQQTIIKENENKIDIKNLENKKSKSNFI
mgnify:CR=1 FL=1